MKVPAAALMEVYGALVAAREYAENAITRGEVGSGALWVTVQRAQALMRVEVIAKMPANEIEVTA